MWYIIILQFKNVEPTYIGPLYMAREQYKVLAKTIRDGNPMIDSMLEFYAYNGTWAQLKGGG